MITIRYSIEPGDLAEERAERFRGFFRRALHMSAAVLIGLMGWGLLRTALSFFLILRTSAAWSHFWILVLFPALLGFLFLWGATDLIGLEWCLRRFTKVYGEREVSFGSGKIVVTRNGKRRESPWWYEWGYKETPNLFLLRIRRGSGQFLVPKRALRPDQENAFRRFLTVPPVSQELLTIRFILTKAEFKETLASTNHLWSNRVGRVLGRAVGGALAIVLPWLFFHSQQFLDSHLPWQEFWRAHLPYACLWPCAVAFGIWVAIGLPGSEAIDRMVAKLDQERQIIFTDLGIQMLRGKRKWDYRWDEVLSFQESEHMFLVDARIDKQIGPPYPWSIPKRMLAAEDERKLRSILEDRSKKQ